MAIVTTSDYNAGIGFAVPVNRLKPDMEEIVSTDSLLRRRKGANVGGGNAVRTLPGWMGMDLIGEREGI